LIRYPEGKTNASFNVPGSVTVIGDYAFSNSSSLASVTIGNSVTGIGDYAFSNSSSLASVTIPDSVTEIGRYAFYVCTSLAEITIPDSVTSIGSYTFYDCSSLASVTCLAETPPTLGGYIFSGNPSSLVIKVPANSVAAYKAASGWSYSRIEAIE
jgi:hypothetical protein